ncbi:MAG: DUF4843 domain-containing protein [Odoribacteraceae bacterium]|jgi:hypothetical protein|nr:DUF4843 domain-containing protein [Odoribacteraceae bacterium]
MRYAILFCCCLLWACEEEWFLYRGERYVQFTNPSSYTLRRSFATLPSIVTRDTVYCTVDYLGDLVDAPLYFDLVQVEHQQWRIEYDEFGNVIDSIALPVLQAEAGVHYEVLDKTKMFIPPRGVSASIPIVFLRASSLLSEERYLRLRVIPGPGLQAGTRGKLENVFLITALLVKPDLWDVPFYSNIFGKYSRVKHRFMIDNSGLNWDDVTLKQLERDTPIFQFYIDQWNEALAKYKAEHGEELKDEEGETVSFPGLG